MASYCCIVVRSLLLSTRMCDYCLRLATVIPATRGCRINVRLQYGRRANTVQRLKRAKREFQTPAGGRKTSQRPPHRNFLPWAHLLRESKLDKSDVRPCGVTIISPPHPSWAGLTGRLAPLETLCREAAGVFSWDLVGCFWR